MVRLKSKLLVFKVLTERFKANVHKTKVLSLVCSSTLHVNKELDM